MVGEGIVKAIWSVTAQHIPVSKKSHETAAAAAHVGIRIRIPQQLLNRSHVRDLLKRRNPNSLTIHHSSFTIRVWFEAMLPEPNQHLLSGPTPGPGPGLVPGVLGFGGGWYDDDDVG